MSVCGPSGCGKTTLLSILGLLDSPSEGSYVLAGEPVSTLSPAQRARVRSRAVGFIFQAFNLIGDLDVYQNVELPLVYRGIAPAERKGLVHDALERVGLLHRIHHYPSQLSGGQQQRVAVARATAGAPLVLLADEPTGNLDSHNGADVMELLDELHAGGATIVMVTHDPRYIGRAQRSVYLFDGRLVPRGDPAPGGGVMDTLWLDLRYALRSLLRSPGFALVAALTLALGIGANTAIFSVVYSVLLRPLAYSQPEQLVSIRAGFAGTGAKDVPTSQPEYQDYQREVPALEDLAAIYPININFTGLGEPQRIQAAVVSDNYFRLLGVKPVAGPRLHQGRRRRPDRIRHHHLLRSLAAALRRRSGDHRQDGPARRRSHDGHRRHAAGVPARAGERRLADGGVGPDLAQQSRYQLLQPAGRAGLRPDRPAQAGQDRRGRPLGARAPAGRLTEQYPQNYPAGLGWQPVVEPLAEQVVGDVRPALLVLLGAVGFVLLIGCANVANLLLARATAREREIAVRTALGGSQMRLVRQLLTESLVLAVVGRRARAACSRAGARARWAGSRRSTCRARARSSFRLPVLGFTAFLILVTGVGFGLIPALQASRPDLQSVLKDAARGSSSGAPRTRMRAALVVAEVAIALMLLAGAGLLLRSFQRLMAVEYGFDPEQLLTLQVWLPVPNDNAKGRFFTQDQRRGFYERALARGAGGARRTPGGAHLAAAVSRPQRHGLHHRGHSRSPPDQPSPNAEFRMVSPNYFAHDGDSAASAVTGLPELADSVANGKVVINRTLAEKYWPGEDPIGRRIQLFGPQGPWVTIVGRRGRRPADEARRAAAGGDLHLLPGVRRPGDVHGGPHRRTIPERLGDRGDQRHPRGGSGAAGVRRHVRWNG